MTRETRRVVTGHDADGKAVVLADGPAPNVKVRQTGIVSTLLWVTAEAPADIAGSADRAAREVGVAPPDHGSILRIVDFPPVTADAMAVGNAAVTREMGVAHHGHGAGTRHPFTHRTRSIDYALVLTGEIDMLLDDTEVHLKAGDVLIQQGTNHAWVNNGTETCRIAFVLIDAQVPAGWTAADGGR